MNISTVPYRRKRVHWGRILLNVLLLVAGIIMILPLIWAFLSSLKPSPDIVSAVPTFWPRTWTLEHYMRLPRIAPFLRFFANSLIVSTVSAIFVIVGSVIGGYVFAKYNFKGKGLLLLLVIATIIIPLETYIIPLFLTIKALGWVNDYAGLIYPTIISSTGIFFLRQHILTIPDELIDAARIDGASEFGVLRYVIFPNSVPAIAAITIVNWVYTWSLFLWPLIVAQTSRLFTMEIGLMYFQRDNIIDYGGVLSATMITLLPILFFFLLFRTRIIAGISTTGMKY